MKCICSTFQECCCCLLSTQALSIYSRFAFAASQCTGDSFIYIIAKKEKEFSVTRNYGYCLLLRALARYDAVSYFSNKKSSRKRRRRRRWRWHRPQHRTTSHILLPDHYCCGLCVCKRHRLTKATCAIMYWQRHRLCSNDCCTDKSLQMIRLLN